MRRPGNIRGLHGLTPRHALGNPNTGLGSFGKGVVAPPPAPPPPQPASYVGGEWQCPDNPPPQEADGYYHCCPDGWTKTPFHITRPCGQDYGKIVCGPLPLGASINDAVCCENMKEWMPKSTDGSDPCLQAALASGRAVPGVPETILAPDIMFERDPLVSPTLMTAGGIAVAMLFIITIVIKLKN